MPYSLDDLIVDIKDIILNAKKPPIKTIAINIIGLIFFIIKFF